MEQFEQELKEATAEDGGYMLGGIGVVVGANGYKIPTINFTTVYNFTSPNILLHHASAYQDAVANSPTIDPNSTISWSAAAKILTNIAALLPVQRSIVDLDEPV